MSFTQKNDHITLLFFTTTCISQYNVCLFLFLTFLQLPVIFLLNFFIITWPCLLIRQARQGRQIIELVTHCGFIGGNCGRKGKVRLLQEQSKEGTLLARRIYQLVGVASFQGFFSWLSGIKNNFAQTLWTWRSW